MTFSPHNYTAAAAGVQGATGVDPLVPTELDAAVKTLQNGVRGYHAAAERVEDVELAERMRELSRSRSEVLARVVRIATDETAYEPQDSDGTIPGTLHRGWLAVKSIVGGDESVIETAKTGEDEAISDLENAIASSTSEAVKDALRAALDDVRIARDSLEALSG